MSKILMCFTTSNNSFQELFNIITYSSKNSKLINIEVVREHPHYIHFKCYRKITVPFVEKLNSYVYVPDEIEIECSGKINSKGDFELIYYFPEKYSQYIKAKETLTKDYNSKMIHTELNYKIEECNESGFFGSAKNLVYNKLIETLEPQFKEFYMNKRGHAFSKEPKIIIDSLEELKKHI